MVWTQGAYFAPQVRSAQLACTWRKVDRPRRDSILTRSNTFLIDLLKEARQGYMAAQENKMCIYVSDM